MNALQVGTLLIVFAGAFGAINHIVFRLPSAIGILIVAFVASLCVLGLNVFRPDLGVALEMRRFVADAEFSRTLLEGMLGLLLFAGALHVRVEDLREQAWTIAVMATLLAPRFAPQVSHLQLLLQKLGSEPVNSYRPHLFLVCPMHHLGRYPDGWGHSFVFTTNYLSELSKHKRDDSCNIALQGTAAERHTSDTDDRTKMYRISTSYHNVATYGRTYMRHQFKLKTSRR